jgi:FkbM family methyltransferase
MRLLKDFAQACRMVKQITAHPLAKKNRLAAISRLLRWQLGSRIWPYPVLYPFVNDSRVILTRGMTSVSGNMYVGLEDYQEMSFLLHFLVADDHFVDVGANVGVYTILASAVRGALTTAIEPIPNTFRQLNANIRVNDICHRVTALNIGVGRENTRLWFTTDLGTRNHVLGNVDLPNNALEMPVSRLEDVLKDTPIGVKIDAEGFEHEILDGADKVLSHPDLKFIIIEAWQDKSLKDKLASYEFESCAYDPMIRELSQAADRASDNAIFVRDLRFVKQRLGAAPRFSVLDTSL